MRSRPINTNEYCATPIPQSERAAYWTKSVTETLFPLTAEIRDPSRFSGSLRQWDLQTTSLSHFLTDGVFYKRERHHLKRVLDEELLITFALRSEAEFSQNAVALKFKKDEFILQRGNIPYEFGHADANELLVLKVKAGDLGRQVRSVDRFTTLNFDASRGMGRLLLDTLRTLPERLTQTDPLVHRRLGTYLIDLLGLTLEADDRILSSNETTVKRAHLARIEHYIRQNLQERSLSPETIAAGCGISVRYLHDLFNSNGKTVSRWIRELRLKAAHDQISDLSRRETIAEIAYRWGFGDQAQFSRHYKVHFGETPRETRGNVAG